MSNLLRKFRKEKKDYKTLYESELNNRKIIELRYKELKNENIELQKGTGLAELRVKYNKALDEIHFLKEDRANLYIQLEDTRNENKILKGFPSLGVKRVKKGGKKKNGE